MFILAFTCDREAKSMPPTHVPALGKNHSCHFARTCASSLFIEIVSSRRVSARRYTTTSRYCTRSCYELLNTPPPPPPRCASRSNSSAICFLSPVLLRSIYPSIRVRERARSADEFNGSGNFQIFRPRAIRLSLLDIRLPLFTQKSNIVLSSCRET